MSVSVGRIPIFVDTDCVLPFEELIDWRQSCIWVSVDKVERIGDQILSFHQRLGSEEFINLQMRNRKRFIEWLRPEQFFANLHIYLNAAM